eukprot:m51a1_g7709 hypothetical protein (165) ;mRNA; f:104638-105196
MESDPDVLPVEEAAAAPAPAQPEGEDAALERVILRALAPISRKLDILYAKQENSTKSRSERLVPVPRLQDGKFPKYFPICLSQLLVGGSEALPEAMTLPGGRAYKRNTWNKKKSYAVLRFYGIDDPVSGDEEDETTAHSRARRLAVARAIGVTEPQLNFAKMGL